MEEQRVRAGAGPIPSAHLGFVDATKGLGILAVIWGHMDYLWSTSSVWFSSFKLAVFFVVVGLLKARRYEARGQEESCGAVWGKRLYSLVIPYGVYSLLAILAHLAFAAVRHQGMLEALRGDIFLTITLRGIATLWFLPTLLLAELLFAAIRPESRCRAVKLLLCILMPVLLWAVCWFYEGMDLPEGLLAQAGQNLFVVAAKSVSGCWFMLCSYYIYRHLDPQTAEQAADPGGAAGGEPGAVAAESEAGFQLLPAGALRPGVLRQRRSGLRGAAGAAAVSGGAGVPAAADLVREELHVPDGHASALVYRAGAGGRGEAVLYRRGAGCEVFPGHAGGVCRPDGH